MIGTNLSYLRKRLDAHLREAAGAESDGSSADRVVFLESDKLDPLKFPEGCISMLVLHINENREFRDADRYQRRHDTNGTHSPEPHYPDINLEIAILFVARFKDYANAWNQLGEVILFFQENPIFEKCDDPNMPTGISRLALDLISPNADQQTDIWNALRVSIHPAIQYRLRMLTIRGKALQNQAQPVREVRLRDIRSSTHAAVKTESDRSAPVTDKWGQQPP
jgi:hypothetical protein